VLNYVTDTGTDTDTDTGKAFNALTLLDRYRDGYQPENILLQQSPEFFLRRPVGHSTLPVVSRMAFILPRLLISQNF